MKKLFITFLLLAIFVNTQPILAQESGGGRLAYEKGDFSLNAGMSFGLIGYGYGLYGSSSFAVPLVANVDIGISEYFSVGGFVGYLGIHRFYTGNILIGIIQLITGGGFGIW